MMIIIQKKSCQWNVLRRETDSEKEVKNVLRVKNEMNMWRKRRGKEKP